MTPRLDRKVALEERAMVPDGAGGFSGSWTPLGTLWADFTPRTGRGAPHDEVAASLTLFDVVVRSAPVGAPSRPRPGQRLVEGPRSFSIVSVTAHKTLNNFLTLKVEEEVAR